MAFTIHHPGWDEYQGVRQADINLGHTHSERGSVRHDQPGDQEVRPLRSAELVPPRTISRKMEGKQRGKKRSDKRSLKRNAEHRHGVIPRESETSNTRDSEISEHDPSSPSPGGTQTQAVLVLNGIDDQKSADIRKLRHFKEPINDNTSSENDEKSLSEPGLHKDQVVAHPSQERNINDINETDSLEITLSKKKSKKKKKKRDGEERNVPSDNKEKADRGRRRRSEKEARDIPEDSVEKVPVGHMTVSDPPHMSIQDVGALVTVQDNGKSPVDPIQHASDEVSEPRNEGDPDDHQAKDVEQVVTDTRMDQPDSQKIPDKTSSRRPLKGGEAGDKPDEYERCRGSYEWDIAIHSPNVEVRPTKPWYVKRQVSKQTSDGARGNKGFSKGKHLFQFLFNKKPWGSHCSIGVCTEKAELVKQGYTHLFGQDGQSWCWDLPSGALYHQGVALRRQEGGDALPRTLFMYLNMNDGFLGFGFDPDSAKQSLALAGLTGEVFPCVSMVYGRMKAEIRLISTDQVPVSGGNQDTAESTSSVRSGVEVPPTTSVEPLERSPGNGCQNEMEQERANQETLDEGSVNVTPDHNQTEPQYTNQETVDEWSVNVTPDHNQTEPQYTNQEATEEENMDVISNHTQETTIDPSGNTDRSLNTTPTVPLKVEESAIYTQSAASKHGGHESEDNEISNQEQCAAHADDHQDETPTSYLTENEARYVMQTPSSDLVDTDPGSDVLADQHRPPIGISRKYTAVPSLQVESLTEEEQYLVSMSHGWDPNKMGGSLLLYPNIPNVCLPMANFGDKIQMVKGRRGVSSGRHRWLFQELEHRSDTGQDGNVTSDKANDLIIGVASNEQRSFNFGFSLSKLDDHAWGWQPSNNMQWCGLNTFPGVLQVPDVDWTKGVIMTLDLTAVSEEKVQGVLTFEYEDEVLATVPCDSEDIYFPFAIYHKQASAPIRIRYLEGPRDSIRELIGKLQALPEARLAKELTAKRKLAPQSSFRHDLMEISSPYLYTWEAAEGVTLREHQTIAELGPSVTSPLTVSAQLPISGKRHIIDFFLTGVKGGATCIVGLTAPGFSMDSTYSTPSPLGGDINSWGLDVVSGHVYHGGSSVGKLRLPNVEENMQVTLTIDFPVSVYNRASIRVCGGEGTSKIERELGIVFLNLPEVVVPAVAACQCKTIRIAYQKGPEAFVTSLITSKACVLL